MKKNITRLVVGPISTNCWIYRIDSGHSSNGEVAVIDPGDEADKIVFTLKKMNLAPKYILLTHGHFDHILGVSELSLCSGNPEIAIHRLDAEYLGPGAYQVHSESVKAVFGDASFLDVYWSEMPSAGTLLEEGSVIGPFTVLHLPGHTRGSAAFWDKEQNNLFTGDTLFANSYGRTDLPGGSEKDMQSSLKRLFDMNPDITVYPGHGGITTIGKERGQGI